ncbi:hypothetical protein [Mycobacterium phage WXIN]|nr:hypothetical protein [Mycobacterium phage WXIN]
MSSGDIYLIRPCQSSCMDKSGMRRRLKPNLAHGAWIIGPGTREALSHRRKWTDIELPANEASDALRAESLGIGTFFGAKELPELGIPVAPIPTSGLRRWWWMLWNDAGGTW